MTRPTTRWVLTPPRRLPHQSAQALQSLPWLRLRLALPPLCLKLSLALPLLCPMLSLALPLLCPMLRLARLLPCPRPSLV